MARYRDVILPNGITGLTIYPHDSIPMSEESDEVIQMLEDMIAEAEAYAISEGVPYGDRFLSEIRQAISVLAKAKYHKLNPIKRGNFNSRQLAEFGVLRLTMAFVDWIKRDCELIPQDGKWVWAKKKKK